MSSRPHAGLVADLWRFPVKSMAGERVEVAPLTSEGLLGDRALALLDVESGAVVSASSKHFPGLMNWRARYAQPPRPGADLPAVHISNPAGDTWTTEDPAIEDRISAHFGRRVALVRARTPAYAAKQAAFFADIGLENVAPARTLVDLCPVSVISTSTLAELGRLAPESRFDPRRFRMNILVSGAAPGFPDTDWVGASLIIGNQVRLHVAMPDPRCSMTTLPQGDLPKDPGILRTIAEAASRPVGASSPQPCAGVYATVVTPGTVKAGDPIRLSAR